MGEIGVFLRASSYLHDKEPVVLRCSVTARALDSEALSLAPRPVQPAAPIYHQVLNHPFKTVLSSHLNLYLSHTIQPCSTPLFTHHTLRP